LPKTKILTLAFEIEDEFVAYAQKVLEGEAIQLTEVLKRARKDMEAGKPPPNVVLAETVSMGSGVQK